MKVYLFILLIAFIPDCYGQKTISFEEADSLSKHSDIPIEVLWDSSKHSFIYRLVEGDGGPLPVTVTTNPSKSVIDTVLVVMFMCDTSDYSGTTLNGNGIVFWQLGWEVRETFESFTSYKGVSVHDFDHIDYLDFDKNKLPPNIIVLQSK